MQIEALKEALRGAKGNDGEEYHFRSDPRRRDNAPIRISQILCR